MMKAKPRIETHDLIDRLATGVPPVRPLASPGRRLAIWLAVSLPFTGLVVWVMSPRADLLAKLSESRFLLEQSAALITAVTAALVAFMLVVPGKNRHIALLPLIPGGIWIGTLGAGCIADWLRAGAEGLRLTRDAVCLVYVALIGSLPAATIVWMLRRGAPVAPRSTLFLAVLGSAALGNFGLRFFHLQDAGIMVLFWQFGSVMLLATLAGLRGQSVLFWRHLKV